VTAGLVIEAIEDAPVVALVVKRGEFGSVQEPCGSQPIHDEKVAYQTAGRVGNRKLQQQTSSRSSSIVAHRVKYDGAFARA
jgi:hypothetical protein